jgi:hypothetical protein
MRKTLTRLAVVLGPLAIVTAAALPATAMPADGFFGVAVQSQAPNTPCAAMNGVDGDPVNGKTCDGSSNQKLDLGPALNHCSGGGIYGDEVTSTCPFTVGLGLNTIFQGDLIEYNAPYSGNTTYWHPNNGVVDQTSGTTGIYWVLDGSLSNPGARASFISVAASNALNTNGKWMQACTNGTDAQLQLVENPTANRCYWQFAN